MQKLIDTAGAGASVTSPGWLTQLGRLWGGKSVGFPLWPWISFACMRAHHWLCHLLPVLSCENDGQASECRTCLWQTPNQTTSRICWGVHCSRRSTSGWRRLAQCTCFPQVLLLALPAACSVYTVSMHNACHHACMLAMVQGIQEQVCNIDKSQAGEGM